MHCAWLTGNERGGWAVCHIANVIGNAPRTYTHTRTHIGVTLYLSVSLHTPTHTSVSPSLSVSISFAHTHEHFVIFLSSHTHTHALPLSLNHSHTPIYALNVWLCGVLLQVNNERRGVWPCQKSEKLTQRNQTGAETPQPWGHKVCVWVCVIERGEKVCVSIPIFSWMTYVRSFTYYYLSIGYEATHTHMDWWIGLVWCPCQMSGCRWDGMEGGRSRLFLSLSHTHTHLSCPPKVPSY